uniref:Lysozyme 1 n=1 Tax=Lygus hesperus TaxID=30085 RepID=A0A0A9Z1K7_LYGHE
MRTLVSVIAFSALLAALAASVGGRTFTAQELAKELRELRVSEWEIPTLVCVAYNASELQTNRTSTLRMTNIRQTMVYVGLFGFPVEWLVKCDLKKEQVLDDNIENDVNCLLSYLQTSDRRSALHQLTPGEVDLDKCLDWWDQLPPSIDPDPTTWRPPTVQLSESPGTNYWQTVSLYILDAVLVVIAYFIYMLIQVQKRNCSVDTISNFPLV